MGRYNFPGDIVDDISSIRSDLQRIQAAPQLANSAINGSSGNLPVNNIAFGEQATTNFNLFTCAGNFVWRQDLIFDQALTVQVTTGRLLITLSAQMWQNIGASNAIMSYFMTGPTTAVTYDAYRAIVVPALSGAQAYSGGSFSYLHTGLELGQWTVQPIYACGQYSVSADSAYFQNRTVIAKPY